MRIFKALSHTKTLSVGRFNFDKSGSINVPTLVIKINTPASVEVNRYNESKINNKTPKIEFDDLSTKELQQLLDFVV